MKRKFKQEMRGAMRELRKDNQFIAAQRFKEEEKEAQRQEKRKREVLHLLQSQQAEHNKAKKSKPW